MEYLQYSGDSEDAESLVYDVLNLIISGIPSILLKDIMLFKSMNKVLNLIISGIPSIHFSKSNKIEVTK